MAELLIKNVVLLNTTTHSGQRCDVIVRNGIVTDIAEKLPQMNGMQVIDAEGRYMTAGWIDAHAHLFTGLKGPMGVDQDKMLADGVTFCLDAGTAGVGNIEECLDEITRNRVVSAKAYLNLAFMGVDSDHGELIDLSNVDLDRSAAIVSEHADKIIGIKLRIDPRVCREPNRAMSLARELADRTKLPLIVHASRCEMDMADVLSYLQAGDVFAHTYANKLPGILDENGKIKPCVLEARKRGVIFDLSHGKSNFAFSVFESAMQQGFLPDVISTDLHQGSLQVVNSLADTMTKVMACGMDLWQIIDCVTTIPKRSLGLEDKAIDVQRNTPADLTVFGVETGSFTFRDADGTEKTTDKRIVPFITVLKEHMAIH